MGKVFHGGRLDLAVSKYGGVAAEWLDMSTGINPNAYPLPKMADSVWNRLPDNTAMQKLLSIARTYYRVPDSVDIVAGNGTQAFIQLLPSIIDAQNVTIVSPTYNEYRFVWSVSGRNVSEVSYDCLKLRQAEALVVVNPNNPTTHTYSPEYLVDLSKQVSCMVVDEAFADTNPEISIVPKMPKNMIVLKSFGKFFGLAGVRLGFAICEPSMAEKFSERLGPWSASGPAMEIGTAALADETWIQTTRRQLEKCSSKLASVVEEVGLNVVGVNPLFVFIKDNRAGGLYHHLALNKILVRPFPEYPDFLRIGLPANSNDLARFESALKSYQFD